MRLDYGIPREHHRAEGEQDGTGESAKPVSGLSVDVYEKNDSQNSAQQHRKYPAGSPGSSGDFEPDPVGVRQKGRLVPEEVEIGSFVRKRQTRGKQVSTFIAIDKSALRDEAKKQSQNDENCEEHNKALDHRALR